MQGADGKLIQKRSRNLGEVEITPATLLSKSDTSKASEGDGGGGGGGGDLDEEMARRTELARRVYKEKRGSFHEVVSNSGGSGSGGGGGGMRQRSSSLAGASAARSSDGSAKGKSKLGIRTKNAGILSPRVDVDKCNNKDGGTDAPAAAAAQVEKKVIRVTLPDGSTKGMREKTKQAKRNNKKQALLFFIAIRKF